MEDFRSKSCRDGKSMQIESYYNKGPNSMQNLRSYSTPYGSVVPQQQQQNTQMDKEVKIKKGKGNLGNSSSSSKGWSFNDPELQRKKRVASYKVYGVEGKMKGSLRKSFRWIKNTYTQVVYGWP